MVITSLRKQSSHIPFRQSLLTRFLRDSLLGNCQVIMISTIAPGMKDYNETISTIRFAKTCYDTKVGLAVKGLSTRRNIKDVSLVYNRGELLHPEPVEEEEVVEKKEHEKKPLTDKEKEIISRLSTVGRKSIIYSAENIPEGNFVEKPKNLVEKPKFTTQKKEYSLDKTASKRGSRIDPWLKLIGISKPAEPAPSDQNTEVLYFFVYFNLLLFLKKTKNAPKSMNSFYIW